MLSKPGSVASIGVKISHLLIRLAAGHTCDLVKEDKYKEVSRSSALGRRQPCFSFVGSVILACDEPLNGNEQETVRKANERWRMEI